MKKTNKRADGSTEKAAPAQIARTLTVIGLSACERLDIYCAEKIPELTRSQLKAGLKIVLVNGVKTKTSRPVSNGDLIELVWENPIPQYAAPENIALNIIYEDKNIIAVNKKAGTVTHPASGNWNGTLVNALNYYRLFHSPFEDEFACILKKNEMAKISLSKEESVSLFRLGIVHRLDKDTSGVIITARNYKTERFLKEIFKRRRVKKYYLAVLDGKPKEKSGRIKTSVFRSKGNRKKFSVSADLSKGKTAYSRYKVLKSNGKYSLTLFRIFTGRTHQIRLHARFIGCPVLGDPIYGKKNKEFQDTGLMLHAYKLLINIDGTMCGADKSFGQSECPSERLKEFKAPLPKRFKTVLRKANLWERQ